LTLADSIQWAVQRSDKADLSTQDSRGKAVGVRVGCVTVFQEGPEVGIGKSHFDLASDILVGPLAELQSSDDPSLIETTDYLFCLPGVCGGLITKGSEYVCGRLVSEGDPVHLHEDSTFGQASTRLMDAAYLEASLAGGRCSQEIQPTVIQAEVGLNVGPKGAVVLCRHPEFRAIQAEPTRRGQLMKPSGQRRRHGRSQGLIQLNILGGEV
jgi:hypothetical protein